MVLTVPTSTSLYLSFVLPGSRPSALVKLMVMVGPRPATDFTTSAMPISAAISGITQTNDGIQRLRGSMTGSGRLGGKPPPPPAFRDGSFGPLTVLFEGPCGLVMFLS